jgi:hypothetical protein
MVDIASDPVFWSSVGFWVLMVGLFGDILVIFVPSGRMEKILLILFSILIAVGVWVEHKADAVRFGPRLLDEAQQATVSSQLSAFVGQRVDLTWDLESFEERDFAATLKAALEKGHWQAQEFPAAPGVNRMPIVRGVLIMTGENDTSEAAGAVLLRALHSVHVVVVMAPLTQFFPSFAGRDRHSTDPYDMRVLLIVGIHPFRP